MGDLFDPAAFALGMVGLINPCGFALLPAYLGFFLGMNDDGPPSTILSLNRAQIVGLSMSAGFLAVFGALGLFLAGAVAPLQESNTLPWVTIVIGAALILLGIAMVAGFQLTLNVPKLNRGGGSRSAGSMFLFGVSYAVASLACTIGPFLGVIGANATDSSFISRFGSFVSYAIGMGLLATVLTLAVGFGKNGIVNRFRSLLPKINLISAVILVVVGVWVILHGVWSIQVFDNPSDVTPWVANIVEPVEAWQGRLSGWFRDRVSLFGVTLARTTILGYGFLLINVVIAAAGFAVRQNRRANEPEKVLVDS